MVDKSTVVGRSGCRSKKCPPGILAGPSAHPIVRSDVHDKGKPAARRGRKAQGPPFPREAAGPPKRSPLENVPPKARLQGRESVLVDPRGARWPAAPLGFGRAPPRAPARGPLGAESPRGGGAGSPGNPGVAEGSHGRVARPATGVCDVPGSDKAERGSRRGTG